MGERWREREIGEGGIGRAISYLLSATYSPSGKRKYFAGNVIKLKVR